MSGRQIKPRPQQHYEAADGALISTWNETPEVWDLLHRMRRMGGAEKRKPTKEKP